MSTRLLGPLLALVAASVAAFGATTQTAGLIEFPHAGISLVLPKGFECRQPEEPFDLMRAVAKDAGTPTQAVSLLAYPVDEKVTVKQFAESRLSDMESDLAIRHLTVVKDTPMEVAGIVGLAHSMTYTCRGEKTVAASVCFIRELAAPQVRICYLLSVECAEKQADKLLPIFGETVKSISLTAVRRPTDLPVGKLGPAVRDSQRGYQFCPPLRLLVRQTPVGLIAAQTDCLRCASVGGLPLPQLRVIVGDVEASATCEQYAKGCLRLAMQEAEKSGPQVSSKVLLEGPAQMAGMEAYQFVLEQSSRAEPSSTPASTPASNQADEPVITVQRSMCLRQADGRKKGYSLILLCSDGQAKAAGAMMQELAEGFSLLAPTTASGPTATATAPRK